ncbi:MAG TPA: hypothetical protein VFH51_19320, partial [Myxococcota bacterium]|nr:hypothetical protein [Myxococcota bacterium]
MPSAASTLRRGLACASLLLSLAPGVGRGAPPAAPAELKPWIDYARALDPDPRCPPSRPCVQLSRLLVEGKAASGSVTLTFSGNNLGRQVQPVRLLEPASAFSLAHPRFAAGQGIVRLEGDAWAASVAPGAFSLVVEARFDGDASVPMRVPGPVARIVDHLQEGALTFEASGGWHGGVVSLQTGRGAARHEREAVAVRVTRVLAYGGVTTFTYQYRVTGLREQTRMRLPLLGDEVIEGLEPALSHTVEVGPAPTLGVTLAPHDGAVSVMGHFNTSPTRLAKPAGAPFETWIFTPQARHPVQLASEGLEIDAAEVPSEMLATNSRVFLLTEAQ